MRTASEYRWPTETRCAILLLRLEQGELVIAPRSELLDVQLPWRRSLHIADRGCAVRDVEAYSGSIMYSVDGSAVPPLPLHRRRKRGTVDKDAALFRFTSGIDFAPVDHARRPCLLEASARQTCGDAEVLPIGQVSSVYAHRVAADGRQFSRLPCREIADIDCDNRQRARYHFVLGGSDHRGRNSIPDHEVLSLFAGIGCDVRPSARGAAGSTTGIQLSGAIRYSCCATGRKIGAADADTACGAEIASSASLEACAGCAAQRRRGWSAA